MKNLPMLKRYDFLAAYLIALLVIVLLTRFLPGFVHPASELVLIITPLLFGMGFESLRWDGRRFLLGIAVTIIIIVPYLFILLGFVKPDVDASEIIQSYKFAVLLQLVVQMFVISLAEEFFFRGFVQERVGMTIKGVLIVSALFAVGHAVVSYFGSGYPIAEASKNLLTFFPSLIMGYLYVRFKNLWPSIFFHFVSNLVYISTGGL